MDSRNRFFSDMEIDALGEIMNISLGSSATSISEMLNQRVEITTPRVEISRVKDFTYKQLEPAIGVKIKYSTGLVGTNILILKRSDVRIIVGLLLGTEIDEESFELDDMNISAICEVMNQMMGASSTALAEFLNRPISISVPEPFMIDNDTEFKNQYLVDYDNEIVHINFDLKIGELVNSEFISIYSIDFAKELLGYFGLESARAEEESINLPQERQTQAFAPNIVQEAVPPVNVSAAQAQFTQPIHPPQPEQPIQAQQPAQPVQPVQPTPQPVSQQPTVYNAGNNFNSEIKQPVFRKFEEVEQVQKTNDSNLDLIMSVPLQISVEIGKARKKVKEILEFGIGTVVELDKQAGSQVDIYVNGKQIARGDVVVVDDYYGVKITEILSNKEIMDII